MTDKTTELQFENQQLKDRILGLEMLITHRDMKLRDMSEKVKDMRDVIQKLKDIQTQKVGG